MTETAAPYGGELNIPNPVTRYFEASVALDSYIRLNGVNPYDPEYKELTASFELTLKAAKISARRCLRCGEHIGPHRGKSRHCSNDCLKADREFRPAPEVSCPFANGQIELEGGYVPDPGLGF